MIRGEAALRVGDERGRQQIPILASCSEEDVSSLGMKVPAGFLGLYPCWEECDGPLYECPWHKVGAVVLHHHIWRNTESSWTLVFSHIFLALLERGFLGVQRDGSGWPKVPAK